MASRLMHYIIANEIIKDKTLDKNLFLLGNLAPDAHDGTLRGNSCAHFRRIVGNDYDKFPNIDIPRFKGKYLQGKADEFTLGYLCHLISDDTWVKMIYPDYLQFSTDDEKGKIQREALFNDFEILNIVLKRHYNLQFKNDITIPKELIVKEFSYEKIDQLLNNLYEDFNKNNSDTGYKIFNIDFILQYMNLCVERCNGEMAHLNF
jgi:hypothetical protein